MNRFGRLVALSTIGAVLSTVSMFAQDHPDEHHDQAQAHDNHQYVRHDEWKKGYHMNHDDWNRGERVDYRTSHLKPPPRGYEWRQVDGNYVMAAIATGVIASVVAASVSR